MKKSVKNVKTKKAAAKAGAKVAQTPKKPVMKAEKLVVKAAAKTAKKPAKAVKSTKSKTSVKAAATTVKAKNTKVVVKDAKKVAKNTKKRTVKNTKTNAKATTGGKKSAKKTAKVTKVVPKKAGKAKRSLKEILAKRKGTVISGAVVALVLMVSGLGIGISAANNLQEAAPEEEISQEVPVEEEPEEPETPTTNEDPLEPEPNITNNATYQVAAHKPRYLSIPSLSLYNIPVIEVTIEADGTLGAPTSDYVIAWYYRSTLPGQPGAIVMDGHGGDLGTGILKTLPRVPMGGEIIIEMGDGRKFTYIVEEKTYKKIGNDADSYMDVVYKPLRAGSSTLTLITCTGAWLRNLQTYDQRLFVRATLKN